MIPFLQNIIPLDPLSRPVQTRANLRTRAWSIATIGLAILCFAAAPRVRANEILFIGNSFTYGGPAAAGHRQGGVPRLVEDVAVSKGKMISTVMLAVGGKDWGFHLSAHGTDSALNARTYDWVVLQDYSTKPTHIGNVSEFLRNGHSFYKLIREHSPNAKIVLYETWARGKGHSFYTGISTPKSFVGPEEMTSELEGGYARLESDLERVEPGQQVVLAPVGTAFALCLKEHPEINIYGSDKYHASLAGSYLAALVIYATVFQDSPRGATRQLDTVTLNPELADKLQAVAEEATFPNHPLSARR